MDLNEVLEILDLFLDSKKLDEFIEKLNLNLDQQYELFFHPAILKNKMLFDYLGLEKN